MEVKRAKPKTRKEREADCYGKPLEESKVQQQIQASKLADGL
jgi:hypothetical protein